MMNQDKTRLYKNNPEYLKNKPGYIHINNKPGFVRIYQDFSNINQDISGTQNKPGTMFNLKANSFL